MSFLFRVGSPVRVDVVRSSSHRPISGSFRAAVTPDAQPTAAVLAATTAKVSRWRIEVSYSSTILLCWAVLLAVLSCQAGYVAQGLSVLALCAVALTSEHGESRLLMPLLFLAELCLAHATQMVRSPVFFYASSLFSYVSLLPICQQQAQRNRASGALGARLMSGGSSSNSGSGGSRAPHGLTPGKPVSPPRGGVVVGPIRNTSLSRSNSNSALNESALRASSEGGGGSSTGRVAGTASAGNLFLRRCGLCGSLIFVCVGLVLSAAAATSRAVSLGALMYVVLGCGFFTWLQPLLGDNEALLVSSFIGYFFCDACVNNRLRDRDTSLHASSATFVANASSNRNASVDAQFTHDRPWLSSYAMGAVPDMPFTTRTHIASRATFLFAASVMLVLALCAPWCHVPVSANSKSSDQRLSQTRVTVVFACAIVVLTALFLYVTSHQFGENVLVWLCSYIYASRLRVWMLVLWFTTIPAVIVVGDYCTRGLRKTVRRKLFHFIAVVAFTPVAVHDPPYLAFALTTATSIAVLVETARCFRVYGTDVVTRFTSQYIDDRDSVAGIVRTHIYLIFGLAVPLYLQYSYELGPRTPQSALLELTTNLIPGITALGIVDASAAIIGSSFLLSSRRVLGRYLKNQLFTERANASITHKTTTGTLGGFVCGVLFWCVILTGEHVPLTTLPVMYTFCMVIVCSLTECFMDGVDNLQMPLVALGAVYNLFALLIPIADVWTAFVPRATTFVQLH